MTLNSYEALHGGRYLSPNTVIHTDNDVLKSFIKILYGHTENTYANIYFHTDIAPALDAIAAEFGDVYKPHREGYAIILDEDINIYAESESGFIYAASDLWRMSERDFVPQGIVYNRPLSDLRYLKLFTPAEWEIEDFKKIVDYCCYCRANGIMIEISGGMEYKNHPEINEKWIEYCEFMTEYSGKTEVIEHGYDWIKNSIHVENGGGKVLSQKTLRELVEYCRARGIDLIPEVPSLSHCDYLILPYPEIAERSYDPYPDTYCPSNPKTYEILFDVLGEIIEVFEPRYINIGHDEIYSIALCERCKGKDPADLLADDIIKIHDFLASHGVRTMMWADKIVELGDDKGNKWGGAEYPVVRNGRVTEFVPAMYRAMDRLPRDIICINWSWPFGADVDKKYLDNGFDMVFGNFDPQVMIGLKDRAGRGVMGAGPSNWSASNLEYVQYNHVQFDLYYSSVLFWNDNYTDDSYDDVLKLCLKDMYNFSSAETYVKPHIEILHTTTYFRQYNHRHDGYVIDYEGDDMGKYVVEYEDSSTFDIKIQYNINISNKDRKWYRTYKAPLFDIDFILYGENYSHTDRYYDVDRLLIASGYTTSPEIHDGDTYYRFVVENPYPEKKIKTITLVEPEEKTGCVLVEKISY